MLGRILTLLPLCLVLACSSHRLDSKRVIVVEPKSPQPVAGALNDLDKVIKKGNLRVGVKKHAPPFSVKNDKGKYVGFDIDMAKALASYLEVTLELIPLDSKDRIKFLDKNKVDLVIATMTITRSREEKVDFSIPYFQDGQALLGLKSNEIDGYRGLKGKKVGVVDGTTSQSNMPQVQPNCEVVAFKTPQSALDSLVKGEVDAFTSDGMMLIGLTLTHEKKDALELKGDKFTVEPYGVAIRQNQSKLRDAVNEGIMEFWETGSWKNQYEQWFGEDTPYHGKNYFTVDLID